MTEHNVAMVETPEKALAAPTNGRPEHYVSPPVDIYERATGFVLVADLPGVSHDNLEVSVANHVVTIKGHVTQRTPGKERYQEFEPVSLLRRFRLDSAFDTERVEAELRNGVLRLHIPKAEAVMPRQIDIRVA